MPAAIDTPALVVFVDRVWANLQRLQADLDQRGVALRPHIKTHKSVRIARMQVDAGARGLTVGTLLTLFLVPVAYIMLGRYTSAPDALVKEVAKQAEENPDEEGIGEEAVKPKRAPPRSERGPEPQPA